MTDPYPVPMVGDPDYRARPASGHLPPITYTTDEGRYSLAGLPGVAVYVVGRAERWHPDQWWATPCHRCEGAGCRECDYSGATFDGDPEDPSGWWTDAPTCEGEWMPDPEGDLYAAMVGDDEPFPVDAADLAPIADDDYCAGCGQIGCGWC